MRETAQAVGSWTMCNRSSLRGVLIWLCYSRSRISSAAAVLSASFRQAGAEGGRCIMYEASLFGGENPRAWLATGCPVVGYVGRCVVAQQRARCWVRAHAVVHNQLRCVVPMMFRLASTVREGMTSVERIHPHGMDNLECPFSQDENTDWRFDCSPAMQYLWIADAYCLICRDGWLASIERP